MTNAFVERVTPRRLAAWIIVLANEVEHHVGRKLQSVGAMLDDLEQLPVAAVTLDAWRRPLEVLDEESSPMRIVDVARVGVDFLMRGP